MKTIFTILLIAGIIFLNGCAGPVGPQGSQGPQGPQGDPGESGYVFEFDNVNFTSPTYDALLSYPQNFTGYDTDVALVYLLWGTTVENGNTIDVWRPLPQTVLKSDGTLIYNFDFTKNDVRVFLSADFSLDKLTAIDTDQWVIRVVVVPGNVWSSNRMASRIIPYNELINLLQIHDIPVTGKIIQR